MRLKKAALCMLFPAALCCFAAAAHASLPGSMAQTPPSALAALLHILPRLALPACAEKTVADAMGGLRRAVAASGLMRDTRPDAAQEKRDYVRLWAALEPHAGTPDAPDAADAANAPAQSRYPLLIPGQD